MSAYFTCVLASPPHRRPGALVAARPRASACFPAPFRTVSVSAVETSGRHRSLLAGLYITHNSAEKRGQECTMCPLGRCVGWINAQNCISVSYLVNFRRIASPTSRINHPVRPYWCACLLSSSSCPSLRWSQPCNAPQKGIVTHVLEAGWVFWYITVLLLGLHHTLPGPCRSRSPTLLAA